MQRLIIHFFALQHLVAWEDLWAKWPFETNLIITPHQLKIIFI